MTAQTLDQPTPPPQPYLPFIESDAHADADDLRAGIEQNSYLFFRELLPPEVVLQIRRDIVELCREAGWLDPTRDPLDAVVGPGVQPTSEGKPDYMAMYRKLLKLPSFRDLPGHPLLISIAQRLLGGDVLVHPRRIGRVTFPNNTIATVPPHQDFFYIRGAVETYTCWVPLGDCPISLGGLAVWPGSHRQGFIEHTEQAIGAVGGRGVPVQGTTAEWHTTDYKTGDALFFHSHSVHKGLPNLSGDRIRLSTDNRYQRSQDDIHPSSLRQHFDLD